MQVSFDAEAAQPLAGKALKELRHILFACNASLATFTEAWRRLQVLPAL